MAYVRGYPYSNAHDLNLDWIIDKIKSIEAGDVTELAELLEVGIEGADMTWIANNDTLIIKDSNDVEIYRITCGATGITLTYNGTPQLTYTVSNGKLTVTELKADSIQSTDVNITNGLTAAYETVVNDLTVAGNTTVQGSLAAGTLNPTNPLAVAKGGTGATTAAAARTALGAMAASQVIPISQGGTGATGVAAAQAALAIAGGYCNATNTNTFTFTIDSLTNATYQYGLLMGGDGTTAFLYMMFMNVSKVVSFWPILQKTNARTFTAAVSGTTMTLTADDTVYGGVRMIWFNANT